MHPDRAGPWHAESNYLVFLSLKNEHELEQLICKCDEKKIKYTLFREPDIGNQITAVALEPTINSQKLVSNIPLALKN